MRIPIDRFRILGVAIGADSHIILNQLERKLERCEYTGFGTETMSKREELLKEGCSFLLDTSKRKAYEEEYIKNTGEGINEAGVNIQRGYEIAGLLLLLEADEQRECLTQAEAIYHGQRMNMNYFSSEYKELNRIIDYATLGLAEKLQSQRYYETAAAVLERRIRSQSVGMGEKEMINLMSHELKQLLPFRVLDMLSRENDDKSHEKGISLLKTLVNERGGLDVNTNGYMGSNEFHAFFRQIRNYLTVQEQIELYEEWCNTGSKAARFLLCIALVAQGFSQRKPSRINESLNRIQGIRSDELEPLIANMHLLLGDVENASRIFMLYADDQLKAWSTIKTTDTLGALCDWCREWLRRDVLKGYRDIDIGPDIESYFSDKDVIRYIEKEDDDMLKTESSSETYSRIDDIQENKDNIIIKGFGDKADFKGHAKRKGIDPRWTHNSPWRINLGTENIFARVLSKNIVVFGIITISSCSLWVFTKLNEGASEKKESPPQVLVNKAKDTDESQEVISETLKQVLSKWHRVKVKSLIENKVPTNAKMVATPELLSRLNNEINENIKRRQRKTIRVEIEDISIKNKTPKRIKVEAKLNYGDETTNGRGDIVAKTNQHTFTRVYSFLWDGGKWVIDE